MTDFVTRYILTLFSASAILAVGVILLMLSIPFTNEAQHPLHQRMEAIPHGAPVPCLHLPCAVRVRFRQLFRFGQPSGGATVFHIDLDCRLLSGHAFHHGIAGFRAVAARPSPQRAHVVGCHHSRRRYAPCVAIPFPEALPIPLCYCHSRLHRANHPLHPYIPQGLQVVRATA